MDRDGTWIQPCLRASIYVYTSHIAFTYTISDFLIMILLSPRTSSGSKSTPNLDAFRTIISNHFGSPCESQQPLQPGAYARTFLYVLQDGLQIVGRVILPARRTLKNEAEVAAMDSIRGTCALPWRSPLF